MANETIAVRGTQVSLETSGAGVSQNTISAVAGTAYDVVSSGGGFPHAEFALGLTFGSNPTENSVVELIARPMDIDGTTDAPVPTATYREKVIGVFKVKADTSMTLLCTAYDLPKNCTLYIYPNNTTQAVTSWTLKATPLSKKPA